MMRMRLVEGLDLPTFHAHTGIDLSVAGRTQIERLAAQGLVSLSPERLHLTRRGLLFADGVIAELAVALDPNPGTALPVLRTT